MTKSNLRYSSQFEPSIGRFLENFYKMEQYNIKNGVSVDIQGDINRDTDSRRVKKNLKEGWKWTLYSPIIVAVFPNEEKLLLDGDHRRHMYRLTFPDAKTIPA